MPSLKKVEDWPDEFRKSLQWDPGSYHPFYASSRSRLLGRRLHPAARLRSAKAPGKDGDRAPSRGGPDANLPARRPPLPRLRGARSPNLSGGRLSFRLLCPPSGDRGGAGRREAQGRDRAAELALRAPWWRSSKARGLWRRRVRASLAVNLERSG